MEQSSLEAGLLDATKQSDKKEGVLNNVGHLLRPSFRKTEESEHYFAGMEQHVEKKEGDVDLPSVFLRMPNTAFGIVMAFGANSAMWKHLYGRYKWKAFLVLCEVCWFTACIIFGVVLLCYLYKAFKSFKLVQDEYRHPVRAHFFNMPNLNLILLCMSIPPSLAPTVETGAAMRTMWGFCFTYQTILTSDIYKMFMFDANNNFSSAKPQFLLSTFGWLLLSNQGNIIHIKEVWGIGLPTLCFGAGFILYIDMIIFIFGNLSTSPNLMGSGALYLTVAAPSVAVMSLNGLYPGEFPIAAEMLLGWVLLLFALLIRLGPNIYKAPSVLGEYFSYVGPIAAATSATIEYARSMDTTATTVLELIMVVIATGALLMVTFRFLVHSYFTARNKEEWNDPLFKLEHYNTR